MQVDIDDFDTVHIAENIDVFSVCGSDVSITNVVVVRSSTVSLSVDIFIFIMYDYFVIKQVYRVNNVVDDDVVTV